MGEIISVGNQSFESIREMGAFYIDKTNFIKEWWENGDIVTLVTRPRRFGKTLNLSMMESFFQTSIRAGQIYLRGFLYGMMKNTISYKGVFQCFL